jgi:hypothetical protein
VVGSDRGRVRAAGRAQVPTGHQLSDDLVPSPGLREVAQVWWDVERDPAVTWTPDDTTFVLVDPLAPDDPDRRLLLAVLAAPAADPHGLAVALAEGLASCDFPPTGDGAAVGRVRATLVAARRPERLAED